MDNAELFPKQEAQPDTHEPLEVFTRLAAEHGLVRPGDKIDQNLYDFATAIVSLCAAVGDDYDDGTENAGDHIRAIYYPA